MLDWLPTSRLRAVLTVLGLSGLLALGACGGGNGAPNNPYQGPGTGPLAITPTTGIAYSGNPFTFAVTGGTLPYTVVSNNQLVVPAVGTLNDSTLVIVPASVVADTIVKLDIRDAVGATTSATVTVKPQLLLPTSITVKGNTSCGTSGATLCSGQNGTASVQVTGAAPLGGRAIRFDVVQGSYSFVSPSAGQPLVSTLTTTTDQNGFAVVTLQVPTSALTQIATIRATDVTSGNAISSNFTIVAFNDGTAVLSVSPTTVSVPGPDSSTCSKGTPVVYRVFGGTPPYTVSADLPTLVTITGSPIAKSGDAFTAITVDCVALETFTITDASGRFINATLSSVKGSGTGGGSGGADCTGFSPAPAGCPTVGPLSALTACTGTGSSASATITGGTTPYTIGSYTSGLTPSVSGSTLTVIRANGTLTVPASGSVQVNAGSFFVTVPVTISSPATCP
jgi:hypothetical protein